MIEYVCCKNPDTWLSHFLVTMNCIGLLSDVTLNSHRHFGIKHRHVSGRTLYLI